MPGNYADRSNVVKIPDYVAHLAKRILLLFSGILLLLGSSTPGFADMSSHYSSLDLRDCPVIAQAEEGDGEWATFRCSGYQGVPVFVSEADLRISLGYGAEGQSQHSFNQRIGAFNSIGGKLEWRLKNGRVVATILRYQTDAGDGARKGQILVVTRVSPGFGEACHVAYVDALANPAANVLARYAADYLAPKFNCGTDQPTHLGRRGVSPF